jgi:hypothetical protein
LTAATTTDTLISGDIRKQCELCHGSGEITETEELGIQDLSHQQIRVLAEADLYRESDGMDEEDRQEMERKQQQAEQQANTIHRNPNM